MVSTYNEADRQSAMKRKRVLESSDDHVSEDQSRQFKRSNLTRLPIRTSPTVSYDHNWHNSVSEVQQPLTPADSSDDEAHGQAENAWSCRRAADTTNTQRSTYRIPLATVAGTDDDEMDLGATIATPTRKRVPSPNGGLSLLQVSTNVLEDRAPTPITARFNLFQDNAKSRGRHVVHHTMLSPMLVEESYLPSPIELDDTLQTPDPETTMRMEHASNGFGALSVTCKDDDMMQDSTQERIRARSEYARSPTEYRGRNAKLHMGFLADCEKCQQRVPGHYSHIIWS